MFFSLMLIITGFAFRDCPAFSQQIPEFFNVYNSGNACILTLMKGAVPEGDTVVALYQYNGKYVVAGAAVMNSGSQNLSVRGHESGKWLKIKEKLGFDYKEVITLAIYRNKEFNRLKIDGLEGYNKKQTKLEWYPMTIYTITETSSTDEILQVTDNPYWSQCPEWPEKEKITIPVPQKGDKIQFYDILPGNCTDVKCQVSEGDGDLVFSKYRNSSYYKFSESDIVKGKVTFQVTAVPYKNCKSEDSTRNCTFIWQKL